MLRKTKAKSIGSVRLGIALALIAGTCVLYIKIVYAKNSSVNLNTNSVQSSKQLISSREEEDEIGDDEFDAQVKQDRKIQSARFKEHPDQLKDPQRCDKLLVTGKNGAWSPETGDSYAMMVACEDVTGITAEKKRAQEKKFAAEKPANPHLKSIQMMIENMDESKKIGDDAIRSMNEEKEERNRESDIQYQEDTARILHDSIRDHEEDRKIQSLREEFQAEDQQRRIDKLEQDEEDDRATDKTIADDYRNHGDYYQARQWEEMAR